MENPSRLNCNQLLITQIAVDNKFILFHSIINELCLYFSSKFLNFAKQQDFEMENPSRLNCNQLLITQIAVGTLLGTISFPNLKDYRILETDLYDNSDSSRTTSG